MQIDLSGKRALITGSSRGIGFAVARGMHDAGATVVVNGRNRAKVQSAIERLGGGRRVSGHTADVGTRAGCRSLVEAIPSIDILVNNVATFGPAPAFEISDGEWKRFFATNVMSGVRLSRAYGPEMVERGWGRILFVSSESALHIPPDMVHYGTTKLAQLGLARGLAESVAGTGVTVNSVVPGPTRSEGVEPTPANGGEPAKSQEEVAAMIVYLASPQAEATTGAAVRVDGGMVRAVA